MSKGWSIEYRLPSVDEIEEDPSFIGDVLAYMNSPEDELFIEVGDTVSDVLERADVDAKEVLNGFANQFAYRSVAVSKSLNGWGSLRVP